MTEPVRARGRPRDPAARAAILRAAAALLDEGGLTAVTMEGIARRAGVGKPTVYRHWPNAAAVAMAAFLETTAQPDTAATANTALDELRLQLAAIACAFAARTGRNVKAMIAASRGRDRAWQGISQPLHCASRQTGRTLLERAAAAGELRNGLDLEVTLDLIYGPLVLSAAGRPCAARPGFTDALLDQVLQGLQPYPVPGTGR